MNQCVCCNYFIKCTFYWENISYNVNQVQIYISRMLFIQMLLLANFRRISQILGSFQTHLLSVKANSVCWIFLNCSTSTDSWKRSDSKEREVHGSALAVWQRTVWLWPVSHTLPSRGPSATETNPNWAVSSPTPTPEPPSSPGGRSGSSPCRSLSRVSCGTLHPHPFRSEKAVSRKPRSRPCSSGFNAWYPAG